MATVKATTPGYDSNKAAFYTDGTLLVSQSGTLALKIGDSLIFFNKSGNITSQPISESQGLYKLAPVGSEALIKQ